jgi:hypothetical protein
MSKRMALLVLVAVFGMGALVGLRVSPAQAAPCVLRCICGTPYKCCTTSSGTICTVDTHSPMQCPQHDC